MNLFYVLQTAHNFIQCACNRLLCDEFTVVISMSLLPLMHLISSFG
jgi:hypothetical protein